MHQAIEQFYTDDEVEDFHCDTCNAKQTITKGKKMAHLPPVLQVSLNRTKYDMQTFDRLKVNDRFEFPLELDMSKYMWDSDEANAQLADPDTVNYELKAIVIHSGGAYGGHYWCYLKDDLKEGNWNLQMPEQFADKPQEVKPNNGPPAS